MSEVRVDKYLWAMRIYKTRSIAADACKNGRVSMNGVQLKPSRTFKEGDTFNVRKGPITYTFRVLQLTENRLGAKLVPEYMRDCTSPEQLELLELAKMAGQSGRDRGTGRPTKKDRRDIEVFMSDNYLDEIDDWDDETETESRMLKSKKDNIAEYILYLWQMEDYLRAFPQQADATPELQEIKEMMHREGLIESGHLQLAKNALSELEELHTSLLNEDAMYRAAIIRLQPSLNLLKAKTDRPTMSDIEASLTLLYQIMLLRLQKREITPATTEVQQRATQVLTFLSRAYRDVK